MVGSNKITAFRLAMLCLLFCVAGLQAYGQYLEVKNSNLRLRQDLTRGGAICYLSLSDRDRNIVNINDEGRYIQQSYYAGKTVDRRAEGQSKNWSPWSWNPIQVGDCHRNRAQILESKQKGCKSYVKCIPMLWDMDNKPAEAVMEQWTTLEGNIVKVRNRLTCHRTDTIFGEGQENNQEIPAVYPISDLNHLHAYLGNSPFEGAPTDTIPVEQLVTVGEHPHFWGVYENVPEKWMAFVDDSGWGMGVYSPTATLFMAGRYTANRHGEDKSPDGATSYIAPARKESLMKNSVTEYTYYIIVGTVPQIRSAVYKLNKQKG